MVEIVTGRHNPLIDPHLAVWEWPIPLYLFLGGLVAGLMVLGGLQRLSGRAAEGRALPRTALLYSPLLLSLGMLLLLLDLAHPAHVFRFFLTFKPASPMSWGSWILLIVYPVQVLLLAMPGGLERFGGPLAALDRPWQALRRAAERRERIIAWAAVLTGSLLGLYTGVLLGVNAARPLWNTSLLAPLFLASGLSAGCAFALLMRPTGPEERSLLRWDTGLLAAELLILLLLLLTLLAGPLARQEAARLLLSGPFAGTFWVLVVALGILLPLWLEAREIARKPAPAWLAPVLVLAGGLALRFLIVCAGQASHLPEADILASAAEVLSNTLP